MADWEAWLWYFINGNGRYMNRWHCSGEDAALLSAQVLSCTTMVGLYVFYGRQNRTAMRIVKESHFRTHLASLCNVFLLCGAIHTLSSIATWVWPCYWFIVAAQLLNGWLTFSLVREKQVLLAIQEHTDGVLAAQQLEDAITRVEEIKTERLVERLNQLKDFGGGHG